MDTIGTAGSHGVRSLMRTVPLTTPDVLVARSEQAGRLALLMSVDRETWGDLDDAERRRTVRRLQFARWRCNREDRLGRRGAHEERMTMRSRMATVVGIAWALLAACEMLARRIGGRP